MIDPIELARAMIRRPSVTPRDEGALDVLEAALTSLGFRCTRMVFAEEGGDPIDNLYARWGTAGPVFAYAGHTDVVPPGPLPDWTRPPFEAVIENGVLWGRGAADMKGGIAAFVAAAQRVIAADPVGSIALIITGDEEGPAINGTKRMLGWMASAGETINHCLVGEPSSNERLGDTIKVGRRGSMNCTVSVMGKQGHVAYPQRADNPIPPLLKMLLALTERPLDSGYERFQASSLQVSDVHVGNPAANVIPGRASARFNIRFNPAWSAATLEAELRRRIEAAAPDARYELSAVCSGDAFLTTDAAFLSLIEDAVFDKTGLRPERSTTGGTSDARYIKNIAPVAEFGLVGQSIHKIDEHASVADILTLVEIYAAILDRYFRRFGGAHA
ncbi:MAG: succinyl-diaminopimelate desuccinylase [Parvularculaceae bacterium]|nr:succinyl-diaminopimelate desuccinylase [Parvularculaceae bacterium]